MESMNQLLQGVSGPNGVVHGVIVQLRADWKFQTEPGCLFSHVFLLGVCFFPHVLFPETCSGNCVCLLVKKHRTHPNKGTATVHNK